MSRSSLPALLLLFAVACGGDNDPTNPRPSGDTPVATVSVEAGAPTTLTVPETRQLTAILRGADGTVLHDRALIWSSSDEAVATVDGSGLVTAVAPGSVTITATSEGKSGAVTLTVLSAPPPEVASVTVETETSTTLTVTETRQLTATLRGADGTVLNDRELTWSSSDDAVATVDASGLVTAVARGWVTITVTSGGKSGAVALIVLSAPPPEPDPALGLIPTEITVGVELPADAGIDPARLFVWSGLGHETLADTTLFSIPGFEGGAQMVMVVDADNHPVLLGFVDPQAATNTLSPRSTAEVLSYFDIGGFLLQQELIPPMVKALAAEPALAPLEAAVGATLMASPHHLDVDATALVNARVQVASALLASADPDASPERVVTVDDPGPRSGIRVNPDSLSSLVIGNDFRRRATAYVDRTEPADGEIAKVDISPTKGITSVFGTIGDVGVAWLLGKDAGFYKTTKSKPIPVPLVPADATRTKYKVTVVGPGLYVPESGDLGEARKAELHSLVLKSLILDFFVPLVTSAIIPMNQEKISAFLSQVDAPGQTQGAAELAAIISQVSGAVPKAVEKASKGEMRGALFELQNSLTQGSNFSKAVWGFCTGVITGHSGEEVGSLIGDLGEDLLKVVSKLDLFLTAQDWAQQGVDILSSNQVEVFPVTVEPWTVNLTPLTTEVELDDSVHFTAELEDPPSGVTGFEYEWVTTGAHGMLRTVTGETGTKVLSTHPRVTYIASDGTTGTDKLEVTVSAILGAGPRPVLGTSNQATIEVKKIQYEVGFSPKQQTVRGGEAVDFLVTIDPTPEGGAFYTYGTSGNYGSISPWAGIPSGLSTVTYTANVGDEGTDNITVEVENGSGESLGSATASVTVEGRPDQLINGSFGTETTADCSSAYIYVPKVEGAAYYAMHAHSFNDPLYWGTTIYRGWSGPGGAVQDVGGQWRFFLSSGCQQGHGSEIEGTLKSRFAGMIIDVTVSF